MERPEIPEPEMDRARTLVRDLDDGAQKFGLYSRQAQIGCLEDGQVAVVMDFRIGDRAFTDDIQNPDAAAEEDGMRTLEADVVREAGIDAFIETRRKLHGGSEDADG